MATGQNRRLDCRRDRSAWARPVTAPDLPLPVRQAASTLGRAVARGLVTEDAVLDGLLTLAAQIGTPPDASGRRARVVWALRDATSNWRVLGAQADWRICNAIRPLLEQREHSSNLLAAATAVNVDMGEPLSAHVVTGIVRREVAWALRRERRLPHAG